MRAIVSLACLLVLAAVCAAGSALATGGTWTSIAPVTSPDSLPGPRIGGGMAWDADRDRMILAGGFRAWGAGAPASPLVVLDGATQWERPSVVGPPAPTTLGPWAIDRSRSRLVALAGLGAIWSMDLDTFTSRLDTIPGPQPYWDYFPVAVAMDSVRDQILAFSIDAIRPGIAWGASLWTVPLHGPPGWTKRITVYAPAVTRTDMTPTRFVYDSRRDRFLFSGPGGSGVLVMDPQPAWLPDPGLYGVPYGATACYDTTRDLYVVFGGAAPAIGAEGTLAWSRTEAPTHAWLETEEDAQPAASDPLLAFDGVRNRMVEAGGHDLLVPLGGGAWSYAPPTPPHVLVHCGVAAAVFPGTTIDFAYGVTNGSSAGALVDYHVSCDRGWPLFPRIAAVPFAAGQGESGVLRFAVPDTAAPGPVTFHVSACCNAGADSASTAATTLLVVTRPSPPEIASAVDVGDTSVALRWSTAAGTATSTTLLRSLDGAAPDTLAHPIPAADGTVSFVDRGLAPGAALRYQLGIDTPAGAIWSDPVTLTLGGVGRPGLAFGAHGATLVVRAVLDVAFTVPAAGAARVEAFDVRGRRVASQDVDPAGAGLLTARLGGAGRLPSGVYLLRLTQGARSVTGRALVFTGP